MQDVCTEWEKWLIRRTGDHFDQAVHDGVPFDGVAAATAHIRYGANLAVHGVELAPATVAEYLRLVAEAIETRAPYMPSIFFPPEA